MKKIVEILMVEDQKHWTLSFKMALNLIIGKKGYNLKIIDNAPEAILVLKDQTFDLIWLDGFLENDTLGEDVLKQLSPEVLKTTVFSSSNNKLKKEIEQNYDVSVIRKDLDEWKKQLKKLFGS